MILTILSKIVGLVRELALSSTYGATIISDAYTVALSIPNAIFGMIIAGIVSGYIPMYSKLKTQKGDLEANKFTNNVLSLFMLFSSVVLVFGLIFTEPIVKVFANKASPQSFQLIVQFTRIGFFAILFTGLISILSGFLQVNGEFFIPELLGFPLNIMVISFIFLSKGRSPSLLMVGFVLGSIAQLLFLLPSVLRKGYTHVFRLDLKSKDLRELTLTSLPIVLGSSVNQINVLIDKNLAFRLGDGKAAALHYAETLNGFVQGIFVVSIVTVLFPMISKMVASHNLDGVKKSVSEALVSISLLVSPMIVGILLFSTQIVTFVFKRGEFGEKAVIDVSSVLFFYSIGLLAIGFQNIIVKVFYSLGDTKSPVIISALGVLLNLLLNLILIRYLGLGGLALGTSLAAIAVTVLLFIKLRKKIGAFGMRETSLTFLKIIFASLLMGLVSKLSYLLLQSYLGENISFVGAVITGACVYFILLYLLKVKEVSELIEAFKRKGKRR